MLRRLKFVTLIAITVFSIVIVLLSTSIFAQVAAQTAHSPSIARMWHGRVPVEKANEYTTYINEAGLKKIRAIEGNLGVEMLRRTENDIAEFYVISYWKSRDAIRKFAGNDIDKASFLPRDREYLINPELRVKHFEVLVDK